MNQRSIHGEVKAKIYKAILLDQIFTVSELCANTGLRSNQIYPVLAKLRRSRTLVVERVPTAAKRANRPTLLYKLTEDAGKRRELADEIAPFLHLSQETLSQSPALERVRRRLPDLAESSQKLLVPLESLGIQQLQTLGDEAKHAQNRFAELKEDLEIAWYESKRSKGGSVSMGFEVELSKFQRLSKQVEDFNFRVQGQIEEFSAQDEFSELLKGALSPASLPDPNPRKVLAILDREYKNRNNFYLKRSLSALAARVLFAERESPNYPSAKVPYVLAEASARFGSEPQYSVDWVNHILSSVSSARGDVITTYNLVNITLLASDTAKAYELWTKTVAPESHHQRRELLATLGAIKHLSVFQSAILISGDLASFSKKRLAEVSNRTGLQGSFSIASTSPVDILGTDPYVVKPTLVDWLEPKSVGFLVSTMMRAQRASAQKEIFSYGPLSDILQFPGLPQVRLGIALVRLGVDVETAWRVSETLKAGKVLLVLHTLDVAGDSTLDALKQIFLESEFEYSVFSSSERAAAA